MLEVVIGDFVDYCKISDFADKSIETLRIRLNEFNEFLKTTSVPSIKDISSLHIREFVGDYTCPSIKGDVRKGGRSCRACIK